MTKKIPSRTPRKPPARPYRIVITMIPAKGFATIRLRGKTKILWQPKITWETGQPTRHESAFTGQTFLHPSGWIKFAIEGSPPTRRYKRKA